MTTIRVGKRLEIERFELYTVPKEERTYPDAEEGSFKAVCGMLGKKNRHWEDLNYHGIFNFYGSDDTGKLLALNLSDGSSGPVGEKPVERVWHEYYAKYTDGELVGIFTDPAQAIEAGAGETEGLDPKDESAVAESHAPKD